MNVDGEDLLKCVEMNVEAFEQAIVFIESHLSSSTVSLGAGSVSPVSSPSARFESPETAAVDDGNGPAIVTTVAGGQSTRAPAPRGR